MTNPKKLLVTAVSALCLFCPAMLAAETTAPAPTPAATPEAKGQAVKAAVVAPDHISVQHILIGFQGSVPGKPITRTQDEAKKLAQDILQRARKGEDFDALVKQYTDDSAPGIYGLTNTGVAPGQGEFPREGMVKGFGDTSFSLKTGEIGIANYDSQTSKYGWHIIKRLK